MNGSGADSSVAAAAQVPAGSWAVGVSGGADSVALLSLLLHRADLKLHVVHLDHETRGDASTGDGEFVRDLASRRGLPVTVARRRDIEPTLDHLPPNPSARYRSLRFALFRDIVASSRLAGVILGHHADDQAETVLSRLLRGSGYAGLVGMSPRATLSGLVVLRPLLSVRRDPLRGYLQAQGQDWREDASNASDDYQRNRLRRMLAHHPALTDDLLRLADACRAARDWARRAAPALRAEFPIEQLASLPDVLARESASRWLMEQGVPPDDLGRSPAITDRLVEMSRDAASASRRHFPGTILVRRRRGVIASERPG
jgi:tRNA(Ile)-lysidine synthetase-like protein